MDLGVILRQSVERKIIFLVLSIGLFPMGIASLVSLKEIEYQTLILAQDQLRESTKTYSLDLFDQLDHAESEMQLMHLSALETGDHGLVRSLSVIPRSAAGDRSGLLGSLEALSLLVPLEDVVLVGELNMDLLFAGLSHVPAGVERCLQSVGEESHCEGNLEWEDAEVPVISADWVLPLSSVYDTEFSLSVTSRQSRESALRHVSLISKLLPLFLVLLMTVAGWVLIRLIRRRMAPLAELEAATERVREGRYEAQVDIKTGDEFQELGEAFNVMTRRLGRSFSKMSGLADIDRLVLDGSDVDEVIRLALVVASDYYQSPCIAYLWTSHCKQGRLYELESRELRVTSLCLVSASAMDRNSVNHREALEELRGVEFGKGAVVRVEGAITGELLAIRREDAERGGDYHTLDELADRISVAVTNLARAESLYQQANYDALTGLLNRQAFSDRLSESIKRVEREGQRGAVLFLDLDRFKQVNDTEGHLVGDELLRRISEGLSKEVRATDSVARLGGDEFAVIAPECGSDGVLAALCRRLIEVVNQPVEINGHRHEVDVSIGVSIYPDDGHDVGTLLMKADVAMYQAKSQSGSTFSFYDSSLNEENERRVQIESGLREALSDGLLRLHFQPKLQLSTMQVRGLEGLLRWGDGEGFRYNPDEFIPVAEDTGLIHRFADLLVSNAAECLKRCRVEGLDIGRIAVNISTRQFARQGFARRFLVILESHDVAPEEIEIEVTESLFMHDAEHVMAELALLRAAGIRIALDDFGTGYSSLNMLRSLPLNAVKIDRSFITPLRDSGDARKVTQKIIEMVLALDLEVVAEGVEHWQEVSLLKRLGCDYVQGYVLAKALPLEELIPFLSAVQRQGVKADYRLISTS